MRRGFTSPDLFGGPSEAAGVRQPADRGRVLSEPRIVAPSSALQFCPERGADGRLGGTPKK